VDAELHGGETAERRGAEAHAQALLVRIRELEAELEAAEEAAAPLRSQIDELRARLDVQAASEGTLMAIREELSAARAAETAVRTQFAAEREARRKDAETVEAWRLQREDALTRQAEATTATAELHGQLAEIRERESATRKAAAAAEERLEAVRVQLTRALAGQETSLAELDRLRSQNQDLDKQRAEASVQVSAADSALASTRAQLAAALSDAEGLREAVGHERALSERARATAHDLQKQRAALQTQLEELQTNRAEDRGAQDPSASAVASLEEEVEELRAVIELQEQALEAAAARERASDGDPRVKIDRSNTRGYSREAHFLFAPGTAGYELVERAGPPPSPGAVIELPGGRTCRVTRVGPPLFPGSPAACAYLERA
jgi:chromosome segregation ATPase